MQKRFRIFGAITIIFTMLIFYGTVSMQMDALNVLIPVFEADYGWSRVAINQATSVGSGVAIATGFLAATLAMRLGIKRVNTFGLFALGAATVVLAQAQTLGLTCAAIIAVQALAPFCMLGALTYNTNWFIRKRGWALGIATMAFPIGTATFTPATTNLIGIIGKEATFTGMGVILAAIAVLGILVIKPYPEDRGLSPDGIPLTEEERARMMAETQSDSSFSIREMFSYKETWFIIIANFFVYFMQTALMSQLIPRFLDTGIPMSQALFVMSTAAVIGIPISYLWGILDDKLTTPIASGIFALTYILGMLFVLLAAPERPVFIYLTIAFVAGATAGHPNLTANIVSYVFGRKNYIAASRFTTLANDFGRTVSFTFMAAIFSQSQSYDNAYKIMIGTAIVAALFYFLIRKSYDPDRGAKGGAS